jgi:hypothetical protein
MATIFLFKLNFQQNEKNNNNIRELKDPKNKRLIKNFEDTKHIKHHHRMCSHFSKLQLPPCKGIETM